MTHINQRRDLASVWVERNPVLELGEVGWERDTRKAKLGDGVNAWNDLPYAVKPVGGIADVPGLQAELNAINSTLSSQQNEIDARAPLNSPTFTGDPKAPTPGVSDNDTSIATTAFVRNTMPIDPDGVARDDLNMNGYRINGLSLPPILGSEAANKTYVDTKAPIASPVFTGNPTAPTPLTTDDDTSIATTAFVKAALQPIGVEVVKTTQTVQNTTGAYVTMTGWTSYNNNGMTVSSSTITVPRAGYYMLSAATHAPTVGRHVVSIFVSGSEVFRIYDQSGAVSAGAGGGTIYLAAGATVTMRMWVDAPTTWEAYLTRMSVVKMGY